MASASANPPRLYLNEHLSPALAAALRQHGFDVVSALEAEMNNKDDDIQLEHAAAQQRAVLTINHRDYAPLHHHYLTVGVEHWGIILSTEESFKTYMRRLLRFLHSVTADELKNQIRWLNEFK